jgi:hypothetical protein
MCELPGLLIVFVQPVPVCSDPEIALPVFLQRQDTVTRQGVSGIGGPEHFYFISIETAEAVSRSEPHKSIAVLKYAFDIVV